MKQTKLSQATKNLIVSTIGTVQNGTDHWAADLHRRRSGFVP